MSPETELDQKAEMWFNILLAKLRYKQDFTVCYGHSKPLLNEDGSQKGISIRRPYIRLFSTGVTKMYQLAVLGEELPDVVYTPEEEKELDKFIEETEKAHE